MCRYAYQRESPLVFNIKRSWILPLGFDMVPSLRKVFWVVVDKQEVILTILSFCNMVCCSVASDVPEEYSLNLCFGYFMGI